ncbi:MAG: MBL fold metallo-hydrolase [Oscillospiraceae bacterium]|jgi:glyoxylase-like metal-dependent hydrolase (beta-lactamase superfamily II)|nr:MBL fold metallo-hydrolase [Oscillospiraceae bacterium]
MQIKILEVGQLQTNCYVVTDENSLKCAVIDPGAESNTILNYIEETKLTVAAIFITHGHFDHVGALESLSRETSAPVFIHAEDASAAEGIANLKNYKDGDKISIGELMFEVIETPGHTPGGVCLKVQDALFTGDTLFRDSCGRTDTPGGDMDTLLCSLRKLYNLSGDYEVYPGHDTHSTLNRERRQNYYMKYAIEVFKG